METLSANQKTWYRNWFNSPYYHQLYFQRDEQEAAAFIDRLLVKLNPPDNAAMLDVACGRGRHSIHLASKGYMVTGIDISEESIAEAKMPDLNCFTVESAMRMVAGTARSMGITVEGEFPAN